MSKQELTEWIERYGQDIYSFCMHLTRSRTEADELYQDTWLKVIKILPEINRDENVKSFCLSVAIGIWKNKKRKLAWRSRIAAMVNYDSENGDEYVSDHGSSPEEELIDRQTKQTVWEAVDRLPEKLRLPVILYYMEKLTLSKIGTVMKIPEGTVKSRLYQARKILEKELGDLYE